MRVARALHDAGGVSRCAAILAAALAASAAGCFFTETINDRPSAVLHRLEPVNTPFRNDPMTIGVVAVDPNGDAMNITWSAFACAPGGTACEATAYDSGSVTPGLDKFDLFVSNTEQTRSVKIVVHIEDSYGAPALQDPELLVDVADHAPELEFDVGAAGPPGAPTRITARATDADDDLAGLQFLSWAITDAPFPSDGTLDFVDDNTDNPDRTTADETYELVPDVEGTWTVTVTVADPLGTQSSLSQPILIGTDHPPCIGDVFPAAPPEGNTMPLDMLRRFSVLDVEDDLDIFPAPSPDDPFHGPATFTWFLASPATGGAYTEIAGATENAYELDPAGYDPGDAVFLRVEIADRIARTLPCPDGDLTCAIDPATTPPCIQRLTWSLEVP